MNHRERVLTTFGHREPDRVPRSISLTPEVYEEFRRHTGYDDVGAYWDLDFAGVGFRRPEPLPDLKAIFGRFFEELDYEWSLDWDTDYPPEWGVATRSAHFLHFSAPVAPMAGFTNVSQLADYPFPDYLRDWRHDHLESEVQRLKDAGYAVTGGIGWIFQTTWTMRSREKLFIDFYDNPEFADALLTKVTDIRIQQAIRLTESGVDMLALADDIGTQSSMIMSPTMWRKWIKPHMAALIAAARRVNPNVHFRYHSDGWFVPVIPDLIEIGVSSLITVQPESMDVFEIKRRFRRDLVLEGTIGCQSELMRGTADEVRQMVKAQCAGLMPEGGFVASSANGVEPDVPWENLVALFEALEEYGRY